MTSATPLRLGAAVVGLLVYGLGVGWALGGRSCPGCLRNVPSRA